MPHAKESSQNLETAPISPASTWGLRAHPRLSAALILGIAVLGTFAVCLDSSAFITTASSILHLPLLSGWKHIPTIFSVDFAMFSGGQFRPLSYALLALLRTFIEAQNAIFWHLWLAFFHWLNALLVALLVHHFGKRFWSALFAGLVIAVHPLATVLVNDVGLFHHLLGLTFYLASFYLYLLADRPGSRRGPYLWSLALFLSGLFVSKVLFTLPLLLAAYEVLYRRAGLRRLAARLGAFAIIALALSPIWLYLRPHPLHYTYTEFPPGTTWFSLFSVIGATEWYARGLFLGWDIPLVLHEVVQQIYTLSDGRLLFWGGLNLAAFVSACVLLRRRHWSALGIVVLFSTMLPYASTTWNSVTEYVSWQYLYYSLGGMALFLGGVTNGLHARKRAVACSIWSVLWIALLFFAWRQVSLNEVFRSPMQYWTYVKTLNPNSEKASVELGKIYLDQQDIEKARPLLFSPAVKHLYASSTALCRYFTTQGEYLPAAIHLRMAIRRGSGLQFGHSEPLAAELMYAVGAHDHAEAALAKVLTANPYDTAAMLRLASIWTLKGYVRAAAKMLNRVRQLVPETEELRRMRAGLAARRSQPGQVDAPIEPPPPSWLRYATQGLYDSRIRAEIIQYSESEPDDPVIQMEAATSLVKTGRHASALERLRTVTQILPNSATAWATHCWAASGANAYKEAIEAGSRAVELDNRNATVHNTLGILHSRFAQRRPEDSTLRDRATAHFREALRTNPQHVSAHVNLARELRHQGNIEEASFHYRRALRLQPDLVEAHFNLGNLLADQGNNEEAIKSYRRAIRAKWDYVEAYYNLGATLVEERDLPGAQHHFERTLQIKPDFSKARDALVQVLLRQEHFGAAIEVLREGLGVTPDNLRGALMLASLLATCPDARLRDGRAAIALAERVCRTLDYANPDALLVLADAYAATGNLDAASANGQRALQIAPAGQGQKIRQRLDYYQQLKRK